MQYMASITGSWLVGSARRALGLHSEAYSLQKQPGDDEVDSSRRPTRDQAFILGVIPTWRTLVYLNCTLLGSLAILSGLVALTGYVILVMMLFTRFYGPAQLEYIRPLYFDYNQPVATAITPLALDLHWSVVFKDAAPPPTLQQANSKFLNQGQEVSISLIFYVPPYRTEDLFQVTGELLTRQGHVVGRSTRSWLAHQEPPIVKGARQLIKLPLMLLGLYEDRERVTVTLFDSYTERGSAPLAYVRANLTCHRPSGKVPPQVYHSEVHLRLKMGLTQRLMYWLRPGPVLSLILWLWATSLALSGSVVTTLLVAAVVVIYQWGGRGRFIPGGKASEFEEEEEVLHAEPEKRFEDQGKTSQGSEAVGKEEDVASSIPARLQAEDSSCPISEQQRPLKEVVGKPMEEKTKLPNDDALEAKWESRGTGLMGDDGGPIHGAVQNIRQVLQIEATQKSKHDQPEGPGGLKTFTEDSAMQGWAGENRGQSPGKGNVTKRTGYKVSEL